MDIKTFVGVVSKLPADISVLVRGPTGIGKSQIFQSIANNIGLPMIDRRLAQMTEGDIIGLPELVDGVTRFAPCDWYVRACKEPVVLFFDEINRATVEVQQCAFQIVLDRELNGHKLHPETRIYSAINAGSEYQVNEMGPALIRRFWTVDLEPTTQDWLNWARSRDDIDPIIVEFIQDQPSHLREKSQLEPGKVYPTPASWHRLSRSLIYSNMKPRDICGKAVPSGFYGMCTGFVGSEAAISFVQFVKDFEYKISAVDIVNRWSETKSKVSPLSDDKKTGIMEKVIEHSRKNDWTVDQATNACSFITSLTGEHVVSFFNMILETDNLENIKKVHKLIGQKVVNIVNASESL